MKVIKVKSWGEMICSDIPSIGIGQIIGDIVIGPAAQGKKRRSDGGANNADDGYEEVPPAKFHSFVTFLLCLSSYTVLTHADGMAISPSPSSLLVPTR